MVCLTSFVRLFPFKSYSTFQFGCKVPFGRKFWGFCGFKTAGYIHKSTKPPKAVSLRQNASFELVIKHICATRVSAGRQLREKRQWKQSHESLHFTYIRAGALVQLIAMDVCTFAKVTNIIFQANSGAYM
jgi:hypothetical protein